MKKELKITLFALGALIAGGMTSCSNEVSDPSVESSSQALLHGRAPKLVAYSGNHYWGSTDTETRSTAYDGDLNNRAFWQSYGAEQLENVTDAERQAVLDAINEKTNNGTRGKISEDLVFPWTAYFIQDVISGQNGSWPGAGSNGGTSASYAMEAYNVGSTCDGPVYSDWDRHHYFTGWDSSTNSQGVNPDYEAEHSNYELVANSAHQNSYYLKGTTPSQQDRINEVTLKYDMTPGNYEDMKGRQFRWYINCHGNRHWSEYIVVKVDGNYYICFDFACGDPENQYTDGHPERGCEVNDWDYNDWIVKITPAGNQPDVWTGDTETPEDPQPPVTPDKCDKCGHPSHGDNCPDCAPDEGCNHQDTPDQPILPDVPQLTGDEVEVNLTIEGEGNDVKQSHLSIHVRAATDVDIFIPCPLEYICPADDMAIVQQHLEERMQHGGQQISGIEGMTEGMVSHMYYKIGNFYIDFYVEFVKAGYPSYDGTVYEEDGIHVWTSEIQAELIDYLERNYGDGITFELWNYFNDDVTFDMLKPYFDRATIKFLDKEPDAYINAYNDTETGEMYDRDCHVGIDDSQKNDYNESYKGNHYNGSPYNDIYTNKNTSQTE